jgi:hypothetical protein
MKRFGTAREAKEFLVSSIVSEAKLENVPLSEVERKELFFSECGWTLPDMLRVNEEFERDYDCDKYERKISDLIRNARKRDEQTDPGRAELWSEAIGILSREDHYILVMIRQAGGSTRPPGDLLKLFLAALAVIALLVGLTFGAEYFHVDTSREALAYYFWVLAIIVVAFYLIVLAALGRQSANQLLGKITDKMFAPFLRTK